MISDFCETYLWILMVFSFNELNNETCFCLFQQKGSRAPQAAGKIHTDFEKGFIMAEVMKFNDFKEEGSEGAAKVCVCVESN